MISIGSLDLAKGVIQEVACIYCSMTLIWSHHQYWLFRSCESRDRQEAACVLLHDYDLVGGGSAQVFRSVAPVTS